MLDRRRFLMAGAGTFAVAWSRPAFAQSRGGDNKLAVIILRGGWDGLNVVAPVGDPAYAELRESLALQGGADAGEGFVFHPALETLAGWSAAGEARWMHAAATPYRERSHFDGQNVLETGGELADEYESGWLNRALAERSVDAPTAISPVVPLIMRGAEPVSNWSSSILPEPDPELIARLEWLYEDDPLLGPALEQAIATDLIVGDADGGGGDIDTLAAMGRIMAADGGADLAVAELGGWDTHANQGAETGQLANRLGVLDQALAALKTELGSHWSNTAVIVVSEFGRTAAQNGTGGTDHGTGGLSLVVGGALSGSGALGDWPGLGELYEDRDLMPVNDLRALFKGVLRDHWGIPRGALDSRVFPGSADVAPLEGLIA